MNIRSSAIVLGTVAVAGFATANFTACIIVGSGGGGIGGDTGSGGFAVASSSSTSRSTTSTSTSSSVSSSGATMCLPQGSMCKMDTECCKGMCTVSMKMGMPDISSCGCQAYLTCAEAITGSDPSQLCDGSNSAKLYDDLYNCQCTGKCMAACAASACASPPMAPDPQCSQCLQDTVAGCGNEAQACANDF